MHIAIVIVQPLEILLVFLLLCFTSVVDADSVCKKMCDCFTQPKHGILHINRYVIINPQRLTVLADFAFSAYSAAVFTNNEMIDVCGGAFV